VPHSEAWFEYWSERFGQFLATGDVDYLKGSSLDFIDEMVARYAEAAVAGLARSALEVYGRGRVLNPPPRRREEGDGLEAVSYRYVAISGQL